MRVRLLWLLLVPVAVVLMYLLQHGREIPKQPGYTLFAAGDTILARRLHHYYYRDGAQEILGQIGRVAAEADIALLNLETVIATQGQPWPKGERRPYYFRGRPELLDILSEAGIDIVTTGNNHAMDFGPEALAEQDRLLQSIGVATAGSGNTLSEAASPVYIRSGDAVVGVVSFYMLGGQFGAGEQSPGVAQYRHHNEVIQAAKHAYDEAVQYADVVIFSPHWGPNMAAAPTPARRQLARQIVEIGYDAILGHSAHRIQGIELHQGRPIIYDMGNFLADWVHGDVMRYGAAFILHFGRRGITALDVHALYLSPGRVRMPNRKHAWRSYKTLIDLSMDLAAEIQFEDHDRFIRLNLKPREEIRSVRPYPRVHAAGSTRRLSRAERELPSNVVLSEAPNWLSGESLAKCEQDLQVLGARHARRAHKQGGFLAEVVLKTHGPMPGRWEAVLWGTGEGGTEEFSYRHPIAHGVADPYTWRSGQYVIDQFVARPRPLPDAGQYRLWWGLLNRDSGEYLQCMNQSGHQVTRIPMGTIDVLGDSVPKTAAGVDWQP